MSENRQRVARLNQFEKEDFGVLWLPEVDIPEHCEVQLSSVPPVDLIPDVNVLVHSLAAVTSDH